MIERLNMHKSKLHELMIEHLNKNKNCTWLIGMCTVLVGIIEEI